MMKKQAFTLVELLAVIVIIGVMITITIPSIVETVENAKKSAAESNSNNYIAAIEKDKYLLTINNVSTIIEGRYDVTVLNEQLEIKGTKPTEGFVLLDDNGLVDTAYLCMNNYRINYANNKSIVDNVNDCDTIAEIL